MSSVESYRAHRSASNHRLPASGGQFMNTFARIGSMAAVVLAALLVFGCETGDDGMMMDDEQGAESERQTDQTEVRSEREMMSDWHEDARTAYDQMTQEYGQPDAMTEKRAVWYDNGPWKRTIIRSEGIPHNFPMEHNDVMEQVVNYRVSTDMVDDLAEYDGSVMVERTSGELSARCDMEAANYLALNLAYEMVEEDLGVDEARQKYGEEIGALKRGEPTEYTQALLFDPMSEERARDPDEALSGMEARQ